MLFGAQLLSVIIIGAHFLIMVFISLKTNFCCLMFFVWTMIPVLFCNITNVFTATLYICDPLCENPA